MADKRYTFRGKAVPLFRIGGTPVAEYSDIKQAIEASDGNPRYVAKVYDIYLDGRKLDARAFGKDGHIYLPVMPLARAAGIKADWSSNWNQIRTPYGSAKAVLKNRSLLIDAADAPALLHLTGSLDKDYNYQMK